MKAGVPTGRLWDLGHRQFASRTDTPAGRACWASGEHQLRTQPTATGLSLSPRFWAQLQRPHFRDTECPPPAPIVPRRLFSVFLLQGHPVPGRGSSPCTVSPSSPSLQGLGLSPHPCPPAPTPVREWTLGAQCTDLIQGRWCPLGPGQPADLDSGQSHATSPADSGPVSV